MHKQINFNKIYTNNYNEKYKIIEDLGTVYHSKNYHSHLVKIKFIDTGYEATVELKSAEKGSTKDRTDIDVNFDKIYHSMSGDYKIIENLGTMGTKSTIVKVKFLNTGNEKITKLQSAKEGNVRDPAYEKVPNINYDAIYHSSTGDYKIIEFCGRNKYSVPFVRISFLYSGYSYIVRLDKAINGSVKDPYYPTVAGIGYIGEAPMNLPYREMLIIVWYRMINRCYNKNDPSYPNYGGAGVKVDTPWLCFANFIKDIYNLPGFENKIKDPTNYHLDKDTLQANVPKSERIYSKYTCQFIHITDNNAMKAIDHHDKSRYYGVRKISNSSYEARIVVGYKEYILGTFDTEEMAAAAYNNARLYLSKNNMIKLLNDVKYIPPDELIKYNKTAKQMMEIIK